MAENTEDCALDHIKLREIVKEHRSMMKAFPEFEQTLAEVGMSVLRSVELGTKALEVASRVEGNLSGWVRALTLAIAVGGILGASTLSMIVWVATEKNDTLKEVQQEILNLNRRNVEQDAERLRLLHLIEGRYSREQGRGQDR